MRRSEHIADCQYDVWKSVRTTNRNLRRTLKRSGTMDGKRETGAKEVAKDLVKHLSPITMEEEESEDHYQDSECFTDSQSRRSFSSERPSFAGTDYDSDVRSEKHIDATAYGSRHKALEVAIKTKTKKFLSYCKLDVLARDKDKDDGKRKRNVSGGFGKPPRESVDVSRRTSMSSVVSFQSRVAPPTPMLDQPSTPPQSLPVPLPVTPSSYNGDVRRPSVTSSRTTASPPQRQPPMRRMSILKRTVSGRSVNTGEGDEVDMGEDNREGIYDTSKKQRVPSWVSFSICQCNGAHHSVIVCCGKLMSNLIQMSHQMIYLYRERRSHLESPMSSVISEDIFALLWSDRLRPRIRLISEQMVFHPRHRLLPSPLLWNLLQHRPPSGLEAYQSNQKTCF